MHHFPGRECLKASVGVKGLQLYEDRVPLNLCYMHVQIKLVFHTGQCTIGSYNLVPNISPLTYRHDVCFETV